MGWAIALHSHHPIHYRKMGHPGGTDVNDSITESLTVCQQMCLLAGFEGDDPEHVLHSPCVESQLMRLEFREGYDNILLKGYIGQVQPVKMYSVRHCYL